ncbi:Rrf2 family transcriptional regulator [bacterium]|nr:Rrf2 family transcriptional regulator [candidate division CSSED10-310 bacterium]
MRLSTRIRYGLRAMMELAEHREDTPLLVKHISDRQEISKKYLENLLIALKNGGLVRSIRGSKGGYRLTRDPADISVADIVFALEGPLGVVDCLTDPGCCNRSGDCVTQEFWNEANEAFLGVLRATSLAVLVRQKESPAAR